MASRKTTTRKTTTRKTTSRKTSTRKAPVSRAKTTKTTTTAKAKTPVAKAPAKPAVQGVALAERAAPAILRKKQLIDEVVARSGIRKKDAKPVVEAMLAVLGEAVAAGTTLNLHPLGKLTVQKQNQKSTARVTVARIRQSAGAAQRKGTPSPAGVAISSKDPLASAAE